MTVAAPQNNQSFRLPEADALNATATGNALATAGPTVTSAPPGTLPAMATEAPTITPLPTFTLPALPNTPLWEHYWLLRPVPEGSVVWTDKTYPYGSTRGGTLRPHHGVEFNVSSGTPVLAAASGTVRVAGDDSLELYGPSFDFYGTLIVLELDSPLDGQPVFTLYGHLSQVAVAVGQHVQPQDVIGLSGATGTADGPHLHFEVRVGQNSYDATRNPLLWLYPFPDRGVVAGRVTWPDGALANEVPVSLRRIDAPSPYNATTTYAGDTVNPDDTWNENFVLDDVQAGYYELTAGSGDQKVKIELWVYPYQTSFIEIVLGN